MTLKRPLDYKEIEPVHPKGNQSWIFIGRTDAEAETAILWPPHAKSWLIGKYSDAGRNWEQEEKGTTEDEMAGWHHRLDRREFEWTPGVGHGQGSQACCDSWGRKDSDMTEQLKWTEDSVGHITLGVRVLGKHSHWNLQFSLVQLLSLVQLFVTPWTVSSQASLSITNSWRLSKVISVDLVMPPNHLTLCRPLLLLLSGNV